MCSGRELFGRKYARARVRFLSAPATGSWFGKYAVKPSVTVGLGYRGPERPGGSPNEPGDGGPNGPNLNPDDPNPRPYTGPDSGSRRPSGRAPNQRNGPAPAEPGTSAWANLFGSAAATVSVPLTFG